MARLGGGIARARSRTMGNLSSWRDTLVARSHARLVQLAADATASDEVRFMRFWLRCIPEVLSAALIGVASVVVGTAMSRRLTGPSQFVVIAVAHSALRAWGQPRRAALVAVGGVLFQQVASVYGILTQPLQIMFPAPGQRAVLGAGWCTVGVTLGCMPLHIGERVGASLALVSLRSIRLFCLSFKLRRLHEGAAARFAGWSACGAWCATVLPFACGLAIATLGRRLTSTAASLLEAVEESRSPLSTSSGSEVRTMDSGSETRSAASTTWRTPHRVDRGCAAGPFAAGPLAAGPLAAGPFAAGPFAAAPLTAGPFSGGPFTAVADGDVSSAMTHTAPSPLEESCYSNGASAAGGPSAGCAGGPSAPAARRVAELNDLVACSVRQARHEWAAGREWADGPRATSDLCVVGSEANGSVATGARTTVAAGARRNLALAVPHKRPVGMVVPHKPPVGMAVPHKRSVGSACEAVPALSREQSLLETALRPAQLPQVLARLHMPPTEIEISHEIGKGAFGTVYAGCCPRLRAASDASDPSASGGAAHGGAAAGSGVAAASGDEASPAVAIKVLHRHTLSAELLERFKRAACLEAQLPSHPNVVRLHGWSVVPPSAQLLLVTELCNGGSLEDAIEAAPSLGFGRVRMLSTALDIARGVAFLHSQQPPMLHRDLKPANILLHHAHGGEGGGNRGGGSGGGSGGGGSGDGGIVAKLADFGVCRAADDARITAAVGTPIFCAPEQLTYREYDTMADVWALGAVLTCIASCRTTPYAAVAGGSDELLGQIASGRARPTVDSTHVLHASVRDSCRHAPAQRNTAAQCASRLEAQLAVAVEAQAMQHQQDAPSWGVRGRPCS